VALAAGIGFALAATAAWVALTAATGKTYHLAPIVIAAAPGIAARATEREVSWTVAAATGLAAVAAGWAVIVAADIEPSAMLVEGQPGGVEGEVVVGALIGAAISAFAARRPRVARA
jgi:hypothetical protein